ncbi:MAG: hypothetical protein ACREBW_00010 [Candidatus Micrarchaeaceae archaeon]
MGARENFVATLVARQTDTRTATRNRAITLAMGALPIALHGAGRTRLVAILVTLAVAAGGRAGARARRTFPGFVTHSNAVVATEKRTVAQLLAFADVGRPFDLLQGLWLTCFLVRIG